MSFSSGYFQDFLFIFVFRKFAVLRCGLSIYSASGLLSFYNSSTFLPTLPPQQIWETIGHGFFKYISCFLFFFSPFGIELLIIDRLLFFLFFSLVLLKWTIFKFQGVFCHFLSISSSSEFFRHYIFSFLEFILSSLVETLLEFLISLLRFTLFIHYKHIFPNTPE